MFPDRASAARMCSEALFSILSGHGKSPWFSRCRLCGSAGVDGADLLLCVVDVGLVME
jgi:hypothetical protein